MAHEQHPPKTDFVLSFYSISTKIETLSRTEEFVAWREMDGPVAHNQRARYAFDYRDVVGCKH